MSLIPPSAIALFATFLYNCINAIFGYLTNVMKISMLQLLVFQSACLLGIAYCFPSADHQVPSLLGCGIYVTATGPPHGLWCPPGTHLAICSIAILSMFGSLLVLSTFHQHTLSEHVTVKCVFPFFTAFVARLWLGEVFTKTRAVCCRTYSHSGLAIHPLTFSHLHGGRYDYH